MTVYVDKLRHYGFKWRGRPCKTCHLTCSNSYILDKFAEIMGIDQKWLHVSKGIPHYDLTAKWRQLAIRKGAVER